MLVKIAHAVENYEGNFNALNLTWNRRSTPNPWHDVVVGLLMIRKQNGQTRTLAILEFLDAE